MNTMKIISFALTFYKLNKGLAGEGKVIIDENIKINSLSVISIITQATKTFEKQREGTIAVISSIAGDRGRSSNYIYGSSKAMISCFLSGLRQRFSKSNVNILTIKPGIINTPMTKYLKKLYPMLCLFMETQIAAFVSYQRKEEKSLFSIWKQETDVLTLEFLRKLIEK